MVMSRHAFFHMASSPGSLYFPNLSILLPFSSNVIQILIPLLHFPPIIEDHHIIVASVHKTIARLDELK